MSSNLNIQCDAKTLLINAETKARKKNRGYDALIKDSLTWCNE